MAFAIGYHPHHLRNRHHDTPIVRPHVPRQLPSIPLPRHRIKVPARLLLDVPRHPALPRLHHLPVNTSLQHTSPPEIHQSCGPSFRFRWIASTHHRLLPSANSNTARPPQQRNRRHRHPHPIQPPRNIHRARRTGLPAHHFSLPAPGIYLQRQRP